MRSYLFFALTGLFVLNTAFAQFSQRTRDSINRLNYEDHRLMMQMLGISELRPGPSGDPNAPNAANRDESKASPYTSLPDPLIFNNGRPVTTISQWEQRRKEIFEDFDREVYGRLSDNMPAVEWKVIADKDTTEGIFKVRMKTLRGIADHSAYPGIKVEIDLTVVTPSDIKHAVPVVMEFGWRLPAGWKMPPSEGPSWQEQLLAKGWGYAILIPVSYQADNGAGLRSGIIGLVNKGQPRKPDDWGSLRAWAWGAQQAMDYFGTELQVDENRVAIAGLSRYGKAALVAMAYEPRIAAGFIGSSGAGGAKILRRIYGEQVENLASSGEYHWFAPNFIKYAGPLTPNDLPVDAHELIALCAPRPVFISSGSPDVEGHWIDAKGMFIATLHAGPVYELYGKKGLNTSEMPGPGVSCCDGELAFRMHTGGHTLGPNWPFFIRFAERYFNPSGIQE
ncbi:MAG: acetylxylan esterase [Bacteroidales bacterium]|nr:acetylxylan esterase [Bacteroidales bacterium]